MDKPKVVGSSMTDEQLAKISVGGPPSVLNGTISLVEYDSSWPVLFERESKRIRSALGKKELMIEHVGSTSVPGLAAKPIIDILVVVENSSDEGSYVRELESVGYVLRIRESDWHEHRMFRGPDTSINMHVFSRGDSEIGRMLLFRDWLRENAVDRERYRRAKRELAGRKWRYVQNYADAKSIVVEEIINRASASRRQA